MYLLVLLLVKWDFTAFLRKPSAVLGLRFSLL